MSFYHGLSENYVHDDENFCYMEMKVSKLYPPDKEHSNVYRYKEVKNRLFFLTFWNLSICGKIESPN